MLLEIQILLARLFLIVIVGVCPKLYSVWSVVIITSWGDLDKKPKTKTKRTNKIPIKIFLFILLEVCLYLVYYYFQTDNLPGSNNKFLF